MITTAPYAFRPVGQPRSRGDRTQPYSVTDPEDFDLARFASAENLMRAFRLLEKYGGHAAGIDGFRPEHFSSSEIWHILRQISSAILDGSYSPREARLCTIPKRSGGTRELAIACLVDRMVAKALQECLKPFWRQHLEMPNHWQILARMDHIIRTERKYLLLTDDIRQCFDNARIADVMQLHNQYIGNPQLLNTIQRIICGHDAPSDLVGLPQGSPYSPTAMEVVLHHHLDLRMDPQTRQTSMLRYVDNLMSLSNDVSESQEMLNMAREALAYTGLTLKGEEGPVQDLRDPNHCKVVLGMIPRWIDGRLDLTVPEDAYVSLQESLTEANNTNRPAETAVSVCIGWLQSYGPALTRSVEQQTVNRVIDMARRNGFRNVTHARVSESVKSARRAWHRTLEEVSK